jgi:hypothetical protein
MTDDDYLPLSEENVRRELERLRDTAPERKARKAALIEALRLAEADPNAWDDSVAFEIRTDET